MAILYPNLTGTRTLPQMLKKLRKPEREEASSQPQLVEWMIAEAKWQWCLERDDGEFLAAACIATEFGRRGWFAGFPGEAIRSAAELRPLFVVWDMLIDSGAAWDELRAWVRHGDQRSIRFAERFGFRYDCGPATGILQTGHDASLFLWRRGYDGTNGRQRGEEAGQEASGDRAP